ncbi:MAG TPA: hypothetical protein VFA57_07385 [Pseudolabrys sp.]|nr:hypothetical protein [Pseudolabrys sp.]
MSTETVTSAVRAAAELDRCKIPVPAGKLDTRRAGLRIGSRIVVNPYRARPGRSP